MLLLLADKANCLVELLNATHRCAGYVCLPRIASRTLGNGNVILGFTMPVAERKGLSVLRQTRRVMQSFPLQPDPLRHNQLKVTSHDQIKQKRPPSVEAVSRLRGRSPRVDHRPSGTYSSSRSRSFGQLKYKSKANGSETMANVEITISAVMVFPFVKDGCCHPTNEEYQEPFSCTVAALIFFGCLSAGFWYQGVTSSPKYNGLSASNASPQPRRQNDRATF